MGGIYEQRRAARRQYRQLQRWPARSAPAWRSDASRHRGLRDMRTPHGSSLTLPIRRPPSITASIASRAGTARMCANQVDAEVERLLIEALQPDRIDLALAAHEQMNGENRLLERQWALNREKAHYEAERARRQYDAVESEKRLVARSLETLWEEKIREADASNRITRGGMSSRLSPWPPPRERVS